MAETKRNRTGKKQMGQFMTPIELARGLTESLDLKSTSIILEPSFGDGSFLIAIIDKLLKCGDGSRDEKLHRIFTKQLYGVELDGELYDKAIMMIQQKYGELPVGHHLSHNDFFLEPYVSYFFDFVIGNPPFGGTFSSQIEDKLDKIYGKWGDYKIKKETYSFFIIRSLGLMKNGGTLRFISSDTFMTINTMQGLRRKLADYCSNEVQYLTSFSTETKYPMVVLTSIVGDAKNLIIVDGKEVPMADILLTGNFSWVIPADQVKYFRGDKLSKYVICTSGMTVGKNEYFIHDVEADGTFYNNYNFSFYDKPITLQEEIEKARLGKISKIKQNSIIQMQDEGRTYKALQVNKLKKPVKLKYPCEDYLPYNKANNAIIYSGLKHIVFWKNNGEAVMAYKKTGNWYLRGVGGQKYFMKEGLTWQLIASRINMKYLPSGYILDSGAPCAFLREGIDKNELWFILGWALTDLATSILKTTINHTKNIQGKDIERLPYPWWVNDERKRQIVEIVKKLIEQAQAGQHIDRGNKLILLINKLFEME